MSVRSGLFGGDARTRPIESGVLGVVRADVAEEGVDGSQPGVAGARAVAPAMLEVVQEAPTSAAVEVAEVELGRRLPSRCLGEAEQSRNVSPVGGDGVALARFWAMRRSVKNASRVGASAVMSGPSIAVFEAVGGQGE